ncbi:hypothetical protein PFICI_10889 [Pestalotiopsis fici W106-1]|uniref:Ubiquitin 3 binding protein But2 C-terminal domain-containing protein n=1 Tax=Pestalotiopsis fici (strain W106-1 / CGMCC3.15140) TaxID=1229662 RepID=W3WT29_PESFW|nr:uncharacterized protein PFICI_10889 [Pestalotiopsis fici W106-1]ETS77015.1 hypothetical protein PFICI_10889 [Pestalotiopsis fici W106-1]
MKSFTAITLLIAAASARTTPIRARQATAEGYIILPSELASHDVIDGDNVFAVGTATARNGDIELSTLYSITFPAAVAGKTCAARFFSGRATDSVVGTGELDFFSTGITDLAGQANGNLRDQALGRIAFVPGQSGDFVVDPNVPFVYAGGFPCPAGQTIVLESAAVGEFDVVSVGQDFAGSFNPAQGVPNGLSFVAY